MPQSRLASPAERTASTRFRQLERLFISNPESARWCTHILRAAALRSILFQSTSNRGCFAAGSPKAMSDSAPIIRPAEACDAAALAGLMHAGIRTRGRRRNRCLGAAVRYRVVGGRRRRTVARLHRVAACGRRNGAALDCCCARMPPSRHCLRVAAENVSGCP